MNIKHIAYAILILATLGRPAQADQRLNQVIQFGVMPKQSLEAKLIKSEVLGKGQAAMRKDYYLIQVKNNSNQIRWSVKSDIHGAKQLIVHSRSGAEQHLTAEKTLLSGQRGQFEQVVECLAPVNDNEKVNFHLELAAAL